LPLPPSHYPPAPPHCHSPTPSSFPCLLHHSATPSSPHFRCHPSISCAKPPLHFLRRASPSLPVPSPHFSRHPLFPLPSCRDSRLLWLVEHSLSIFPPRLMMHGYEHDLQGYREGTRGNHHASGNNCLYAIEWFASTGRTSESHTAVTALWCAGRLLEGVSGTYLDSEDQPLQRVTMHSKRLERFTWGLARDIAELWTIEPAETANSPSDSLDDDSLPQTEFTKGLTIIRATVDVTEPHRFILPDLNFLPLLHKTFCLISQSVPASYRLISRPSLYTSCIPFFTLSSLQHHISLSLHSPLSPLSPTRPLIHHLQTYYSHIQPLTGLKVTERV
jgi:hypothetical protein